MDVFGRRKLLRDHEKQVIKSPINYSMMVPTVFNRDIHEFDQTGIYVIGRFLQGTMFPVNVDDNEFSLVHSTALIFDTQLTERDSLYLSLKIAADSNIDEGIFASVGYGDSEDDLPMDDIHDLYAV